MQHILCCFGFTAFHNAQGAKQIQHISYYFCFTAFQNTQGPKDTGSVSMAVNSSCVTQYLDTVCKRSKVMMEAGAYLHWYQRYGITKVSGQNVYAAWMIIFSYHGKLSCVNERL